MVLTQTSTVEIEHLPPHLQDNDPVPIPREGFALPLEATLAEIERAAIEQALERSGGHRQTAARMLDIGSATMIENSKNTNWNKPSMVPLPPNGSPPMTSNSNFPGSVAGLGQRGF